MEDKKIIYFENGFNDFKVDNQESDAIEHLIGDLNNILKTKGFLISYCIDEIKDKTHFSAWELMGLPRLGKTFPLAALSTYVEGALDE